MKIVMVVAVVVLCGVLGRGLANSYVDRKKFFIELRVFVLQLKSDINFSMKKLVLIIDEVKSNTRSKIFEKLLSNYKQKYLIENVDANQDLFFGVDILSESEMAIVSDFFMNLGKTDVFNQNEMINNFLKRVEEFNVGAKTDSDKYCPLYTKLGILVGLFVALIVV